MYSMEDFPDDGVDDEAARYAAKMTKANVADGTRTGQLRIICHFVTFNQKCGPVEEGFEGRKYSTAVSCWPSRCGIAVPTRALQSGVRILTPILVPITKTHPFRTLIQGHIVKRSADPGFDLEHYLVWDLLGVI
ncbi:hypothetical protein B0H13DRAFT_1867901 [Mycena leptocephala]|nr:hypothetical protein B0H13DRAFT_1867901 [Mycena leptocephala]